MGKDILNPILCTQETKLRALQFNILHRVLPTNVFLSSKTKKYTNLLLLSYPKRINWTPFFGLHQYKKYVASTGGLSSIKTY
jgi:hypothetical protein